MPQPSSFKFFVPFDKAHIDKATNKMVVEGLASTTEVDLTGERMAVSWPFTQSGVIRGQSRGERARVIPRME